MSLSRLLHESPPDTAKAGGRIIRLEPEPEPEKHIKVSRRVLSHRRQKGICHYCEKHTHIGKWTLDHRIPKSRGGGEGYNLIGCCFTCNHAKGDMTEFEFRHSPAFPGHQSRLEKAKHLLKL